MKKFVWIGFFSVPVDQPWVARIVPHWPIRSMGGEDRGGGCIMALVSLVAVIVMCAVAAFTFGVALDQWTRSIVAEMPR